MLDVPKSPVCPGSKVTLVDEISGPGLAAEWKRQIGLEIDPAFSSPSVYRLWRCTRSQLGFITPTLVGDGAFYAELRKFSWYYSAEKWEHREAAAWMHPGARFLDVGCGDGAFVERVSSKGVHAEGLELNPDAVAHAQGKGLKVWARLAREHQKKSDFQPYDFVGAFQVLEHVEDPMGFLQSLVDLLKPGGKLIIAVPNCDGWAGVTGGVLHWPPHHVTWWGAAAFVYLQQVLPLRLAEVKIEESADRHRRDQASALWFPSVRPRSFDKGFFGRIRRRVVLDASTALGLKVATGNTILVIYEKLGRSEGNP